MSGLKTRDFVALRTSCSIDIIVWRNQLKKIQGGFFMKDFKDSKPNSGKKIADVPLMAPVIAMTALY